MCNQYFKKIWDSVFVQKQNPIHTQKLHDLIHEKSKEGPYRITIDNVMLDVFPGVFPPKTNMSASSKALYSNLKDISGKEVLDIGTGTGIDAIIAAKKGAKHVDAIDIVDQALKCAKHNVYLNQLEDKIDVIKSDLFLNLNEKKYDVIMANLPIVDFDSKRDDIDIALYDNNMALHKRLFKDLRKYLKKDGYLIIPHANLQSRNTSDRGRDFLNFEKLLSKFGLNIKEKITFEEFGHDWIYYHILLQ